MEDDHFLFLPNSTIDEITELSTIKTDKNTSDDDYISYYDAKTIGLVVDMYQKDFELYEYDTKLYDSCSLGSSEEIGFSHI